MKFKIPFTSANINKLRSRSRFFGDRFKRKKNSKLGKNLKNFDVKFTRE